MGIFFLFSLFHSPEKIQLPGSAIFHGSFAENVVESIGKRRISRDTEKMDPLIIMVEGIWSEISALVTTRVRLNH
jgi:hypothetical protein